MLTGLYGRLEMPEQPEKTTNSSFSSRIPLAGNCWCPTDAGHGAEVLSARGPLHFVPAVLFQYMAKYYPPPYSRFVQQQHLGLDNHTLATLVQCEVLSDIREILDDIGNILYTALIHTPTIQTVARPYEEDENPDPNVPTDSSRSPDGSADGRNPGPG